MTIATPINPRPEYADGYQRGQEAHATGLPITEAPIHTNPSGMPDDEQRGWRAGWMNEAARNRQLAQRQMTATAHANLRAQVAAEIEHADSFQTDPVLVEVGQIWRRNGDLHDWKVTAASPDDPRCTLENVAGVSYEMDCDDLRARFTLQTPPRYTLADGQRVFCGTTPIMQALWCRTPDGDIQGRRFEALLRRIVDLLNQHGE